MKRTIIIAGALLCALALPAQADELAREANTAFVTQLADTATTRALLRRPCGFERDPIMRPFVRSDASALVGTVALNLVLRTLFRRHPKAFRIVTVAEIGLTANNTVTLRRTDDRPGWVCR